MTTPRFRAEVSVDDTTGRMIAVYMRVRDGEVAATKEVKEGVAYADYDALGSLLGIEILGRCDISVLDSIAANEPESVKQFFRASPPRELVPA
jgi:Protein of unknown function (DUF2283)